MNKDISTRISTKVFNTEKTDYTKPEIIFGQDPGLMDTINKPYMDLWKLYMTLRSLDWSFDEFDYSSCNIQFKTCDKHTYDMMIKTLAYQWEADSLASRSITSILGPVCTGTEAWAGWSRISENEVLHGTTYSEIVRNSFDNPNEILDEILAVEESMARLVSVSEIFAKAHDTSHKYALGLIPEQEMQEAYNDIFMFLVALLCLERIQFMASFAVTFAICDGTGLFQPIGKAVQKICQDEFDIHVQFGMAVLRHLIATERGRLAYDQCLPKIIKLVNEVVKSEDDWIDYAFSEGRELTGVTKEMMLEWNHFSGSAVASFMNIEDKVNFPIIKVNPLKYMELWVDISKTQTSPQEQDNNQYKVGVMRRDDEDETFDLDFL